MHVSSHRNSMYIRTKPVGQDKGRLLREVAVIENEEELSSVLTKTLQRVRDTAGEVPQVALLQVVDEVAALIVESSDTDLTVKNVCPLGLLVPVKLTNDALVEPHVDASELNAGGKLTDGGLSSPSSFLQFNCRVSKEESHYFRRGFAHLQARIFFLPQFARENP